MNMSDIDLSMGLLNDQESSEILKDNDNDNERTLFYIGETKEVNGSEYSNTEISPTLSRKTDFYVEKIEDKRLSYPGVVTDKCNLRKRTALSENDVSFAGHINKKMHEMRLSFEEELKKKMCKDCVFRSIQSKLSMLGIVSSSNKNINMMEETDKHTHDGDSLLTTDNENNKEEVQTRSTLLENLNRRSVSLIQVGIFFSIVYMKQFCHHFLQLCISMKGEKCVDEINGPGLYNKISI